MPAGASRAGLWLQGALPQHPGRGGHAGAASHSWFASYLLGCFHYSKRNYEQAIALWQRVCEQEPDFAPVWRNLGIHHFNKAGDMAA